MSVYGIGDCDWNDYDALAKLPFLWTDIEGERSTPRVIPIQLPTAFTAKQLALASLWQKNRRLKHRHSCDGRHFGRTIHPYYVLLGQKHKKPNHRMLHSSQFF